LPPKVEEKPIAQAESENLPKKIQWIDPNVSTIKPLVLSVEQLKKMYKCVYDSTAKKTYKNLIDEICEKHNIPTTLLWSNTRNKTIVRIRQELWYRAKIELPWMSYPQIARASGKGYDHTTVLHGVKAWKQVLKNNGETI
jgi:chromosomal replication initiation ATPase DnaA